MKTFLQFIILQWLIATVGYSQTPLPPPVNKVALVIGNAQYTNASRLKNPTNDAKAVTDFLRKQGFEVILDTNCTRQAMNDAFYKFERLLKSDGISVFYFSGHGVEQNKRNYICPIESEDDENLSESDKLISLDEILRRLQSKRSRLNLLFLDACRTELTRDGARIAISFTPPADGETAISFAAASGTHAFDGNGTISPYTEAVLNALQQPCAKVNDYFPMIVDGVRSKTGNAQVPWVNNSLTTEAASFSFVCPLPLPPSTVWKISTTFNQDCKILYDELHDLVREVNQDLKGKLEIQWDSAPRPQFRDWLRDLKTNKIQILHGCANYWQEEIPGGTFFASVPFGMEQEEAEKWLKADGLSLWRALYQPHGIKPFPCGHSGRQMGGWFNKEIRHLNDFNGLWMRTTGLAGNVLEKFGVQIKICPASDIYEFLSKESPNRAAQFIGAYDDYNLGLHNLAKYYYEGWQENNVIFELSINQQALDALDALTQAQLTNIIRIYNERIYRKYLEYNREYHQKIKQKNIQFRAFPNAVLNALREESRRVIQNYIEEDRSGQRKIIFESYQKIKRI